MTAAVVACIPMVLVVTASSTPRLANPMPSLGER
eukprot:CAMPEP_0181182128 /NCGR_PEP_ID=MMETSP1096-20121128/7723_1 /TAXON_ID=156174 ORGANISM="Chrysochromulina ericina, Strain CCMP281" /NCGR_SAMPLE_ID=MMETSP1096 /ASSEMBLY_ACC=CAM_ASM_000453 /LENGTH=33 /DNA_ID= /DNA_START= /DNA_END= /DNA_ORIENTATION=